MKFTFDRTIRLIITLAIIICLILLANRLSGVLLPFFVGWLIAYLIQPFVLFIQTKMKVKSRPWAVFIAIITILVVIGGIGFSVIPMIGKEIAKAGQLISQYNTEQESGQFYLITNYINEIINQIKISDILNSNILQSASEHLLPRIWGLISSTWQMIIGLFVVVVTFLYVVFILLDYQKINDGFRSLIPPKHKELIERILDDLEKGMNSYFRGQALVAFIVGILFAIGFKIIGLPMGITIGLFIGVLNLVPYLQTVGIVPVVLLAWIQSAQSGHSFWLMLGLCFLVFIIVQSIQDLVLVPKIMGKAMGLRPAVILLSLSIWGSLLGITGMIVALPLTTLMISYYKQFIVKGNVIEPDNQ